MPSLPVTTPALETHFLFHSFNKESNEVHVDVAIDVAVDVDVDVEDVDVEDVVDVM